MSPGYTHDPARNARITSEAFIAGFGGASPAPGQEHPQAAAGSAGTARFLSLPLEQQLAELESLALALVKAETELAALRKGGK